MTEDELQELLEKTLPAAGRHDVFVEECQDQDVRLRFSLNSGETWTTAQLLSLADTSLRAAAGVGAALMHLSVTVLKAPLDADVIALSRVIRRDGQMTHAEAWLRLRHCIHSRGIIGVNIGANKDSADRIADYADGVRAMSEVARYLTINIS